MVNHYVLGMRFFCHDHTEARSGKYTPVYIYPRDSTHQSIAHGYCPALEWSIMPDRMRAPCIRNRRCLKHSAKTGTGLTYQSCMCTLTASLAMLYHSQSIPDRSIVEAKVPLQLTCNTPACRPSGHQERLHNGAIYSFTTLSNQLSDSDWAATFRENANSLHKPIRRKHFVNPFFGKSIISNLIINLQCVRWKNEASSCLSPISNPLTAKNNRRS